jgi:hypothetical protein
MCNSVCVCFQIVSAEICQGLEEKLIKNSVVCSEWRRLHIRTIFTKDDGHAVSQSQAYINMYEFRCNLFLMATFCLV